MSCLKSHQISLYGGKLYVWADHRDVSVMRVLENHRAALPKGARPDVKTIRAYEQLGKLAVLTRLPYQVLDVAYGRAGIRVPRLPHEPDDEYARRHAPYCMGEIPMIVHYLGQCARYLPQLYRKDPPIEWIRLKLEPFAQEAVRGVSKWYEVCRSQE